MKNLGAPAHTSQTNHASQANHISHAGYTSYASHARPSLSLRDERASSRFYISLALSFVLHALVLAFAWWLHDYITHQTPKLHKVNLENMLVLKRGQSLDKNANTPGAPKPSLAMPQSQPTPPSTYTPPIPNQSTPTPSQKQAQNMPKPQTDSGVPTPAESYNPRDLKLFNPLESMAQSNPRARSSENDKGLDRQTSRAINELYGDEWGDLGNAEKDYVTSNLREIARITQSYLEYPQTAAYLRQSGENAVEFYLLPNGDIDGLKLLLSSGFVILDKNSTKTIEIAFKDYPRPKQRTLIRFHITYRIY